MKISLLLGVMLLSMRTAQATHLLGGSIQAKAVNNSAQTYEVTVLLYMNEISGSQAVSAANSLTLCFGDGTSQESRRQSHIVALDKGFSLNTYRVVHTYAGPGTYTITTSIFTRTIVQNIANASNQLFTLNTTISTSSFNQTPTPSFPATSFLIGVNQKAVIALGATDDEGDSLVYSLARPLTSTADDLCGHQTVGAYQYLNDVMRQGIFKLNSRTGDLTWDAPAALGYYSVALIINEYRNGILISQTLQEVTLIVDDLPGIPSTIPPYEPASQEGIVTAITQFTDTDMLLSVFPNPADKRLQVLIQTSNSTTATVRLIDTQGRKVQELKFARAARKHEQIISLDGLAPGVYLLHADVNGRSLVRKIVKQ